MDAVSIHLLIVEDNPRAVALLTAALADMDTTTFVVTVVEQFSQGLAHLCSQPCHMVLLDLHLFLLHGGVGFSQLQLSPCPVILLAKAQDESLAAQALGTGAQDYLIKEAVTSDLLRRVIRYAMAQHYARLELAAAHADARAAVRAKSAFLANMSHEIRTPLNAVIGMTDLLRDMNLAEEQREILDVIYTGGQSLLSVMNDVLDFARIEAGHLVLDALPFNLPDLLESTRNLVYHGAQQKGLEITICCAPDVPRMVMGDEARLRQMLLNLIANAVKFTEQGRVTIELRLPDVPESMQGSDGVLFVVRDTGIGMAPEQLVHIFEPFVQVYAKSSRCYGGTGLGLAICQRLATCMGGRLGVESSLGVGSTFTLRLPLAPAPAADCAPSITIHGPLRVLIAEDNPINQHVLQRMLHRMGHHTTLVENGQAALEIVLQQPYDVILMDIQMPVMDGEMATHQIRQRGRLIEQPYIIALTANAFADDRERALQVGMDDYLTKPVQMADLQHALNRMIYRQHRVIPFEAPLSSSSAHPPSVGRRVSE